MQGKAKVSWKSVCLPKCEGGLGIRRLGDMNKALMTSIFGVFFLDENRYGYLGSMLIAKRMLIFGSARFCQIVVGVGERSCCLDRQYGIIHGLSLVMVFRLLLGLIGGVALVRWLIILLTVLFIMLVFNVIL